MHAPGPAHCQYAFGDFVLDVARGSLRHGGRDVRLRRQSFEVLRYLVERHGRLVAKTELLDAIWGKTVVTDGSLAQCLIEIRRAIGDESRTMIRTLPRRGYIFDVPVRFPTPSREAELAGGRVAPGRFSPAVAALLLLFASATAGIAWLADSHTGAGRPEPANAEAYEHYLQGRFFRNRGSPGDAERAEAHFVRAVDADPAYARAWSELAGTYLVKGGSGDGKPDTSQPGWREAVEQALEHGPELAEAHVRAYQYYRLAGEVSRAREHRQRALSLDPDDRLVLMITAEADIASGRVDEGLARMRRAVAMDLLSAVAHSNFAYLLATTGRYDEALAEEQRALALNPSYADEFHQRTAAIHNAQGRSGAEGDRP